MAGTITKTAKTGKTKRIGDMADGERFLLDGREWMVGPCYRLDTRRVGPADTGQLLYVMSVDSMVEPCERAG